MKSKKNLKNHYKKELGNRLQKILDFNKSCNNIWNNITISTPDKSKQNHQRKR